MLIGRKTNGKEVTVNMQEVSYGRNMWEKKPDGKSGVHSVAACIDMEPVNSRHAISLYSTLWITDPLSVELGFRIPWAEFRISKPRKSRFWKQ